MTGVPAPAGTRGAGDHPLSGPTPVQRRQVLLLGALVLATTVALSLAAFADPGVDEPLARALRDLAPGGPPGWLGAAGEPWVVVALAAGVLLGARCRSFVPVAAATLGAAGLAAWLLPPLVARPGPAGLPGQDSCPSAPVLLLTVVAGLVPMALGTLTGRHAVHRAVTALLGLLAGAVALAEVLAAERWPLDVVAGASVGAALVVVARLVLERPGLHPRCDGCPWQRRAAAARETAPVAVELDPQETRLVHRLALAWVALAVAGFGLLALTRGLPRTPESGVMGGGFEKPFQWSVLTAAVLGVLLARRWHVAGAVLVATAAALLGYFSSVQYPPVVALAVTGVLWVPAVLLWLEWHRRTTLRAALAASVVTSVVLGLVVGAAATTYDRYWGPTHPASTAPAPDTGVVEWMWAGGVTPTSARVRLRTSGDAERVALRVSTRRDLSAAVVLAARPDRDRAAAFTVTGLRPGTRYWYAAEVDGELAADRVQTLRTFPEGPASFSFVVGSCQRGGSNGRVFDAMRASDPLFVLATGDWNYANIERDDPDLYRDQYDLNLTAPAQAAMYARAPAVYVWDDHDYGGNNADRTSPSRPAASATYRQLVPHYPLAGPESDIHQAFTVGRVRFLVMDTRASRDPAGSPSGAFRSALGAQQRAWLLSELAQAGRYGLVVLVSPDPWIAAPSPAGDTWGGFEAERRVVAGAVARHAPRNLLMLAGDAHMLAFDDGRNTGGFPLLHAAALDRPGSVKGGPYSGPVIPGSGQFGEVAVQDDGTTVTVTLAGRTWDSRTLFTKTLTFPR